MNDILSAMKRWLSPKEWALLIVTLLLSALIVSSIYWLPLPSSSDETSLQYDHFGYNFNIEDTDGEFVTPFYTIFQVVYESLRPQEEKDRILDLLDETLPFLHGIADRHRDFYDGPDSTTLLNNIKQVNQTLASEVPIEISYELYRLLEVGKELGQLTEGKFNIFVGELSAFWNDLIDDPTYPIDYQTLDPYYDAGQKTRLEHLQSFVPLTAEAIDQTLSLAESNGKYYAQLMPYNAAAPGELSITLGALAKGFANDVLSERMLAENLSHGFINNGTSSITTLGSKSDGQPWLWNVTSPSGVQDFAFNIRQIGRHSLSTSGSYQGVYIPLEEGYVLRHHIIDPFTGYPSEAAQEVSVLSTDLSSVYLDGLSTTLMTLSIEEGLPYIAHFRNLGYDLNATWTEVQADYSLKVSYTEGFSDRIEPYQGTTYLEIPLS